LEVSLEDDDRITGSDSSNPATLFEAKEKEHFLTALFPSLNENSQSTSAQEPLARILQHDFQLKPEDKLLLKLCYQDGVSVARAGRMLGLNRYQVHGRLRRLLARIRQELQELGVDGDFRLFLGHSEESGPS
jgi:DNA-directed RNA polymerase specialized sigma24 family protein